MQSQKLPLWQLFLFPCAKQRYLPPSRQPGHSAHIRSGIHGTLRSRHTAPVPGNSTHAGPHGTADGQSSRHPRTRLKARPTPHTAHRLPLTAYRLPHVPHRTWLPNTPCTTKPSASLRTASVFPRRASPRGPTFPGSPDPPAASLPPGKPGSVPGITPFRESPAP